MRYMVRFDLPWSAVYLAPHGITIRGLLYLEQAVKEARQMNEQAGLDWDERRERERLARLAGKVMDV